MCASRRLHFIASLPIWRKLHLAAPSRAAINSRAGTRARVLPNSLVEALPQANGEHASWVLSTTAPGQPVTPEIQDVRLPEPDATVRASCRPCRIFICYAREDCAHLQRFKVHLKPFERDGLIERWDDTRLVTGKNWGRDIETAIAWANVAVLLVSPDFFASDFINQIELPRLLAAHQAHGLILMPVILGDTSYWENSSLKQFAAVNRQLRALDGMTRWEQDTLWTRLVDDIKLIACQV